MPIKPENRHRYPAEWPEIRQQVLRGARYRCEWPGCGARHHAVGEWISMPRGFVFEPVVLGDYPGAWKAGQGWLSYREARILVSDLNLRRSDGGRYLVIVLTIAHRDHQPENCNPANLAAWCQRHHLAYDQKHHLQTAYMSRKALDGTADLFQADAGTQALQSCK